MSQYTLDAYTIHRELGAGGFGTVYLAEHQTTGQLRALKVVQHDQAGYYDKEIKGVVTFIQSGLADNIPGLMPIYEVHQHEGFLYYTMPLADGPERVNPMHEVWKPISLAQRIRQQIGNENWFEFHYIKNTMLHLAEAVNTLHLNGITHRDIKPDNVLFLNGITVLGDISLLSNKQQDELSRAGTRDYLPPMQYIASGGNPDMWALAITFYVLSTGRNPKDLYKPDGFSPRTLSLQGTQFKEEYRYIRSIILKATSDTQHERYQDLNEFKGDICKLGIHAREEPKGKQAHDSNEPSPNAHDNNGSPTIPPDLAVKTIENIVTIVSYVIPIYIVLFLQVLMQTGDFWLALLNPAQKIAAYGLIIGFFCVLSIFDKDDPQPEEEREEVKENESWFSLHKLFPILFPALISGFVSFGGLADFSITIQISAFIVIWLAFIQYVKLHQKISEILKAYLINLYVSRHQ